MAREFGGRYSPGGDKRPPGQPRPKVVENRTVPGVRRASFLYLAPLPLIFSGFAQNALGMALDFAAAAVIAGGVYTLIEGLKAEAAFEARKVARRPTIPRKILAAVICGVGVAMAAFHPEDGGFLEPIVFGAIAAVLHIVAFGIDPSKDKGMEGIDRMQSSRVAEKVEAGELLLKEMSDAAARAGVRGMEARVNRFATTARDMFRTVESDPRDLSAARRFLGVYLQGARDATVQFADLASRPGGPEPDAQAAYFALLDDLEESFEAKTRALMEGDRTRLDVEIEVLRDRLKREGVRLDPKD